MPEHIYIDKCNSLAQWRCNNYDTGLMQQKLSSITSWSLLCNDFGQIVHMSSDTEYLLVAKGQWCSVKVTTGLVSEWSCITRLSGILAWSSMAYDSQISTLSMLCNITPFTFIQLLQCLFISVSQVCSGMACITNESLLYLDNANTLQTEKKHNGSQHDQEATKCCIVKTWNYWHKCWCKKSTNWTINIKNVNCE